MNENLEKKLDIEQNKKDVSLDTCGFSMSQIIKNSVVKYALPLVAGLTMLVSGCGVDNQETVTDDDYVIDTVQTKSGYRVYGSKKKLFTSERFLIESNELKKSSSGEKFDRYVKTYDYNDKGDIHREELSLDKGDDGRIDVHVFSSYCYHYDKKTVDIKTHTIDYDLPNDHMSTRTEYID